MLNKIFRVLSWVIVCLWLVIIFNFSAEDGNISDDQSKGFITNTVAGATSVVRNIGVTSDSLNQLPLNKIVNKLNAPIRKAAHAGVYFVLAIFLLIALNTHKERFVRNGIITLLICFVYALTDEYHQTFVPGRAGMFTDCLIDTLGAVIACIVYGIGIRAKSIIEKKFFNSKLREK